MKFQTRFLEIEQLSTLERTIGSRWIAYGAEDLSPEFDVATETVHFETSVGSFALSASDEVVEIFDEPESLAVLYLTAREMPQTALRRGSLSRLFTGSKVKNVYVLLSQLEQTIDRVPEFNFRSHDGIVFELEAGWIGFSKESLWDEDIHISCGKALEKLDLYRALDDWASTLDVVNTGFTTLIEITEWLSDAS